MPQVELVGVDFDGYGRPGHQADAARVLREQGLEEALARHGVTVADPLELPPPSPARGADTSLINEAALVAMSEQVGERVASAVAAARFPLVHGADCTTLLGTVPRLRRDDPLGLLFVDGHEDTMPLDVSEDGEAANTEIGLLLGLTGRLMAGPLAERLPAIGPGELAMLGQRDTAWRQRFNVGSLGDLGVWERDWSRVAADPRAVGALAVQHLRRDLRRWWLHVDLDVLDPRELGSQGLPDVPDEPGGLTWDQLTTVLTTAVRQGGCVGWSVAIYDPDQDPDRTDAARILGLVTDVVAALP